MLVGVGVGGTQALALPRAGIAEGATLGIPCMTAHRSLFLAGPVQGRTVLVTGTGRVPIYAAPGDTKVVALADPGATARLVACAPRACRVRSEGIDGWIPKSRVWGVGANEVFDKLR